MTLQRQILFWLAVLGLVILALWLLSDILLPFIAGFVLAYFLDPVADWFEAKGFPRLAATLIILGASILVFILMLFLLVPVLSGQITSFATKLPGYITTLNALFNEAAPQWIKDAITSQTGDLQGSAGDLAARAAGWLGTVIGSLLSGGLALVNMLSLLIITPIVAFYMLNDWDRMVEIVDGWLPREHRDTIRQLARDINAAMAGFIRGQSTVCIVLGLFYAFALIGAGLNFGLLIGLAAGLLSFIPYVGSIVGAVLSIGMALVQFWPDWTMIAVVAGIFAIGQFVEGNFLSPNLVGERIGLHPVWLMFSLYAFGYLFGFAGLLVAVPLAAASKVLTRFGLDQYLSSKFYLGSHPQVKEQDEEKQNEAG